MGTQVAVTLDTMLKPSYTVSTVLATAFAAASTKCLLFIGNNHGGGKHFEVTGIRRCLETIRENGSETPTAGKSSYAKVAQPALKSSVSSGFNVAASTALTGTVTVTAGTKIFVGVNTLFTTELSVGDVIVIETESLTVATITDITHLTTAENHVAGAAAKAIALSNTPTELEVGIWYGETFQPLLGSTLTPHVLRSLEKYLETTQKSA
jgi:hypothetical protein